MLAMTKIVASRLRMYYLGASRYIVPWMPCTLQAMDLSLVHRGTGRRETNPSAPRSRGRKAREEKKFPWRPVVGRLFLWL